MVTKTVTPKGTLEWVNIVTPKANLSGTMQFSANLVLEANDPYIKEINDFWEENKPKGFKRSPKSNGVYDHKTKDANGEVIETGKKSLSFKTGTSYPDGSDKIIKTYNSKAREVSLGNKNIGNGSVGVISGAIGIYEVKGPTGAVIDAGVTLYLDSIQILKLVEFSNDPGFKVDDSEDGFTGEDNDFEDVTQQQKPVEL